MYISLKSFVKYCLGFIYRVNPVFRFRLKNSLTVFVFHEVSDSPSEFTRRYDLSLTLSQFKQQANWIGDNFNVINPELLIANAPLPNNAALITFDDGFAGVFKNAYPILNRLDMPSVMFMNMQPQITRLPMLSALVVYMMNNCVNFREYIQNLNLKEPAHLYVTPEIIEQFKISYDLPELSKIIKFQGDLVDSDTMAFWDDCSNVYYGNHLYDHWNATALSQEELKEQYALNELALEPYHSSLKLFAFTNGKPEICFSQADIETIIKMGAKRIFSTVGGVNKNSDNVLLGRVFSDGLDVTSNHLWCRVGLSYSKKT
ncbi:polysaccharide deacetylase family protein [Amylibacter sp.]|nr:polysaccharide deacetylase family protein [Amylibacter sp.]